MPFYIYARVNRRQLDELWENLKTGVESGFLSNMSSLAYPHHITISRSFNMSKERLVELKNSLRDIFSRPLMQKHFNDLHIYENPNIIAMNIVWNELSMRAIELKTKFPELNLSTEGYHLTLCHGTDQDTMIKVRKMIDSDFTWKPTDCSVILWEFEEDPQSQSYFNHRRRIWKKVETFHLK